MNCALMHKWFHPSILEKFQLLSYCCIQISLLLVWFFIADAGVCIYLYYNFFFVLLTCQLKDELCKENLQLAGELFNFLFNGRPIIKLQQSFSIFAFTTEENLQKEPRIMELRNQVRIQSYDQYAFFFFKIPNLLKSYCFGCKTRFWIVYYMLFVDFHLIRLISHLIFPFFF